PARPPPPQSVQRSPLPQPLPRPVPADTVVVDTAAADMAVADTALPWPRMVAVWARTLWVAGSALADWAAVDSPSAGTVWRVRSPFMAAGGFTPGASPPGFAAFPSYAGPPSPSHALSTTLTPRSGIPAPPPTREGGAF